MRKGCDVEQSAAHLLKVDQNREVFRWEEIPVHKAFVLPHVFTTHDHILPGAREVRLDQGKAGIVKCESECGRLEGDERGKEGKQTGQSISDAGKETR